jgi:hypothetical protein
VDIAEIVRIPSEAVSIDKDHPGKAERLVFESVQPAETAQQSRRSTVSVRSTRPRK